ncbi:hypothetical protein F0562_000762 [Nyssa sinensis]|uniref:INO80 complex subunit B-like conserved region domain-containing protein n=1 Tax=Nyssa sinensis TaxID=561372 RepID=A0A5J5C1D1_9ASTE|nr:hypothetical protein F0562_000762 [Nyssa sinensis]
MEEFGSPRFEGIRNTIRKKRSQTSRRPRPESQPFPETCDRSPLSSTPPSDDGSRASSDENNGCDANSRRKDFNLNQCSSRDYTASRAEGEYPHKKIKEVRGSKLYSIGGLGNSTEDGHSGLNHKRCSEGVLAPANWKSSSKVKGRLELQLRTGDHGGRNSESQSSRHLEVIRDGVENENKVKKVKLKVGSVTRTIQTKSNSHGASGSGSSTKSAQSSDAPRPRQKMILQENSDDDHSPPDKKSGLQGIPWKDFSRNSSSLGKDFSMGKMPEKKATGKQGEKSEPVRKSKRVPKRRVLDGEFDEDDEDDEIRYLEKLKTSKLTVGCKYVEQDSSKKQRSISRVFKSGNYDENLEDFGSSRSIKDGKKSRSERESEDTDYEEELVSDCEPEDKKKKKPRKDLVDLPKENKRETTLTTRQRALLSGKDASSTSGGASLIEFPNGLPPAPPRKQKEKLSEVEQQLKKSEAAQRRRMQVEKAARESEAEAIRKILGQDSSRKKREDKIKKRLEELAQEKAANALTSNTIRWVMGPAGTVVSFPEDMGLPSIFDSKPCSYPPPREKCAGPSCSNTYKYRDSKTNLPLCSLQCYKAIHGKMEAETPC